MLSEVKSLMFIFATILWVLPENGANAEDRTGRWEGMTFLEMVSSEGSWAEVRVAQGCQIHGPILSPFHLTQFAFGFYYLQLKSPK